jgi:hypothetical protein
MAGNARFHDKLHSKNHHSLSTTGFPDSGNDPIASPAEPFQGDFVINGSLSTNAGLNFLSANIAGDFQSQNLTVRDTVYTNFLSGQGSETIISDGALTGNGNFTMTMDFRSGIYAKTPTFIVSNNLSAVGAINSQSATINTLNVNNNATVNGNLFIAGNLSAMGDVSVIETNISVTSSLSVNNVGASTAFSVNQQGAYNIASFRNNNNPIVVVDGSGITTYGSISSSGNINSPNINNIQTTSGNWNNSFNALTSTSGNWNSVYSSVSSTSSNWNNSFNALTSTSANWNLSFNTVSPNSANWNNTYNTVNTTSANWNNSFNALTSTSANWNSSFNALTSTSADWNSSFNALTSTSGNWNSVYNSVSSTSSNWDNSYNSLTSTSGSWDNSYNSLTSTSANWNSSYNSLTSTSGSWDSVYNSVSSTSGNWNNTFTFVNANSSNLSVLSNASNIVSTNSANWNSSYTSLTSTSSNWNNSYNTLTSSSANWDSSTNTVSSTSGQWLTGNSTITFVASNINVSGELSANTIRVFNAMHYSVSASTLAPAQSAYLTLNSPTYQFIAVSSGGTLDIILPNSPVNNKGITFYIKNTSTANGRDIHIHNHTGSILSYGGILVGTANDNKHYTQVVWDGTIWQTVYTNV